MQIFKEFSFKINKSFKFELSSTKIDDEPELNLNKILVNYKILNNTDIKMRNLKMKIYLFQTYEDKILFNSQLEDNIIFYEGSLEHYIQEYNENEELNFSLTAYVTENEHIFTSCLIIDEHTQVIYMSPVSISLYIK